VEFKNPCEILSFTDLAAKAWLEDLLNERDDLNEEFCLEKAICLKEKVYMITRKLNLEMDLIY
jgi:hypothetical protein